MKKYLFLLVAAVLTLAGCTSDDDHGNNGAVINPSLIVGKWEASHHSKNPNYGDTADMWDFTFDADGTGKGPFGTGSFRYQIEGNRITLHLTGIEAYYGQTEFEYDIVSISKDNMEWDGIPNEHWDNYGLYLMFYRK